MLLLSGTAWSQGTDQGKLKKVWHNMLARYNTYYHAVMVLDESLIKLEESHKDDFSKVITVFPDGDENSAKGITAGMDEIMSKTSKLIQARPNSKWVDDAFLLVAQSHFYRYDLYSALEAFQYVYSQYNDQEIKYDAQLWILRTLIRQKKLYDAESIYNLIQQEKKLPKRLNKMLYQTAAEMYIRENKYSQALEYMLKAEPLLRTRTEKYRSHFILGQIYQKLGNHKESYRHFEKTVKMFPPYEYAFQANLGMSRMLSQLGGNSAKNTRKYLKQMLKDDKNLDYFDEIYFELGNLEMKDGKTAAAVEYYKLSAWSSVKNKIQKANSYLALANLYFERKDYPLAQAYFDSTAAFITKEHPQYEQIIARQNVLSDLIKNLVTIETQDSLMNLSKMNKADLDKFVERMVQKEKEAKAAKEAKGAEAGSAPSGNPFDQNALPTQSGPVAPSGGGADWYFYNQSAMSRGYTEFTRKWGSRKHTEFWRIAAKAKEFEAEKAFETPEKKKEEDTNAEISYDAQQDKEQQAAIQNVSQDLQKYYVNIPFSEQAKKVSHIKTEKALFNAGKVYQENLKEYLMAISYYEKLRVQYPESDLNPEAIFNMIRCYEALENTEKVKELSIILNQKYPKSPFNMVINNKDVTENAGENKKVVALYNQMYDAYQAGKYKEAKAIKLEADKQYSGNSLQSKFDLLYAFCVARTDSLTVFLDLLQIIKENYVGTSVAVTATEMLEYYQNRNKPKVEVAESAGSYTYQPSTPHLYILTFQGGNAEQIKRAYGDFNKDQFSRDNLQVVSTLLGDLQVLMVKSFKTKADAEKYYVRFISNRDFFDKLELKKYDNLFISEDNFKILLKEKEINNYFDFFTKFYIQ